MNIDHTDKIENRISEIKIHPRDICSFYQPRDICIVAMRECWYCRYADFQLGELKPLEVGDCLFQRSMGEKSTYKKGELTYE